MNKKEALKMRGIVGMLVALALAMPWRASSAVYAEEVDFESFSAYDFLNGWIVTYNKLQEENPEVAEAFAAETEAYLKQEASPEVGIELAKLLEKTQGSEVLPFAETPEVESQEVEVPAVTDTAEASTGATDESEPEEPETGESDTGGSDAGAEVPDTGGHQPAGGAESLGGGGGEAPAL